MTTTTKQFSRYIRNEVLENSEQLAKTVASWIGLHRQADEGSSIKVDLANGLMDVGDYLTKRVTAATSLDDLIAPQTTYIPTLRADVDARAAILADIYDYVCEVRGVEKKAWRGQNSVRWTKTTTKYYEGVVDGMPYRMPGSYLKAELKRLTDEMQAVKATLLLTGNAQLLERVHALREDLIDAACCITETQKL